jgi:glyoxylase-like metal-dependent hydrolase (beta-lactamase superfamily II)
MQTLAPGVVQLSSLLPNAINAYLIGDVLVDSRIQPSKRRLLGQLQGRTVTAHVVTHAHPDHFGSSHAVCTALGIPLMTGEKDVEALETGTPVTASGMSGFVTKGPMPKGHPVDRALREGDEVAGFTVLDAPGHSPGHIALWRESDRTLVCGDVFFNVVRLGPPPKLLTVDPERNRASMRRLAELRPALAVFGHGPPVRDPERLLRAAG